MYLYVCLLLHANFGRDVSLPKFFLLLMVVQYVAVEVHEYELHNSEYLRDAAH